LKVRVSIGTLAALGLEAIRVDVRPGVAYLLQYSEGGCLARCAFCTQSSVSRASRDLLSRVVWPVVELEELLPRLPRVFRRVCIQTVIKEGFLEEVYAAARSLASYGLGVSVSTTPIPRRDLEHLREVGVDYIGVGLDAASPELASAVGKPYSYWEYLRFTKEAVEVFGTGRVVVHVIVGLGEDLRDLVSTLKRVYSLGARASLFAFTPIRGTPMEGRPRPSVRYYRLAQLVNYALSRGLDVDEFLDTERGCLRSVPAAEPGELARALLTAGCPGCNRPYYTESPGGELYNVPSEGLLPDIREVLRGLSC
jgi:biotin synthase